MTERKTYEPKAIRRILFVGGALLLGFVLLLVVPTVVYSRETGQGMQEGWQELLSENFSGGLGTGWSTIDASTLDGGDYTWGPAPYTYTSPVLSVWGVGGGTDGEALVAAGTYTYPDNVDTWLVYGPIDTQGIFQAELSFDWWLDSAPGDWLGWCLTNSIDVENPECEEVRVSGSIATWISGTVTLDTDREGELLYLAFHFTSNGDGQTGTGAFIDNVRLMGDFGRLVFLPAALRQPTPTPSATPTPDQINYYDSFASSSTGWRTHNAACCLSGCDSARENLSYKYNLWYEGGRYHVNIPLDCRAGGEHGDTRHIYPVSFVPNVPRPTGDTCLGMRGSFENWDPYWSFWGLVFAASSDMSTVYSIEVNNLGDWAITKRTGYQYPGPNHPFINETRTHIVDWNNGHRPPAVPGFDPNTMRVRISGNHVILYINGEQVHEFWDDAIPSLRYVGIIGGNWEITPTQIGYDYFFIDEGCDDY